MWGTFLNRSDDLYRELRVSGNAAVVTDNYTPRSFSSIIFLTVAGCESARMSAPAVVRIVPSIKDEELLIVQKELVFPLIVPKPPP